jgi:hypothetical protein
MGGSFEAWLESILYKIKFLDIHNDTEATNFSAHVGWSIAIPMLAYQFWGNNGVWIITGVYIVESLCWKMFTWNYWKWFTVGPLPADWYNDFVVDLISRLTVPILMSLWLLYRRLS